MITIARSQALRALLKAKAIAPAGEGVGTRAAQHVQNSRQPTDPLSCMGPSGVSEHRTELLVFLEAWLTSSHMPSRLHLPGLFFAVALFTVALYVVGGEFPQADSRERAATVGGESRRVAPRKVGLRCRAGARRAVG